MIDTTRYRIEPRAEYMYDHSKWLVVYDKVTGKYLTDAGGRGHVRFLDSDAIEEYIARIEKEKLCE
jgi:hypothetical protein